MKKILGTALVVGILAYGLNTNVFANDTKVERYNNNGSYSVEKLDGNVDKNTDNNRDRRDRYDGGYCYDSNDNSRGCGGDYRYDNNVEVDNTNYTNM